MPFFRRAEWPRDHRDELVAGALVGAVVIVLGYASGIGAPTTADAAGAPAATPPAATAPPATTPATTQIPGDSGAAGSGAQVPGGTGVFPVSDGSGGTGLGTGQSGAGNGQGTSPTSMPAPSPTSASPTPSPSGSSTSAPPADGDGCEDGEVRLVAPLLNGLTQSLFGVLDGADAEEPTAQPSPCVGLAPLSGLLGGSASATASPSPEATP
ncbi:hypothetical protein ABZT04_02555 [Streptomyces sp. NPDC005492]|uniref:hypothetical protein n=1 Tax=Streptomyces sp. NPDC005492 TaxID=3156883 RepID=UPI0033A0231A